MWRLIKWLFTVAVIVGILLAITGQKIAGRTIQEHIRVLAKSEVVKEGIRDIRALVGEGLKAAGEFISEDVTEKEREQLNRLVREELDQGRPIEGRPGQKALPPRIRKDVKEAQGTGGEKY